jgi:hypothetical protein
MIGVHHLSPVLTTVRDIEDVAIRLVEPDQMESQRELKASPTLAPPWATVQHDQMCGPVDAAHDGQISSGGDAGVGDDELQQAHLVPARPSLFSACRHVHNACTAHRSALVHQQFDDERPIILSRP